MEGDLVLRTGDSSAAGVLVGQDDRDLGDVVEKFTGAPPVPGVRRLQAIKKGPAISGRALKSKEYSSRKETNGSR